MHASFYTEHNALDRIYEIYPEIPWLHPITIELYGSPYTAWLGPSINVLICCSWRDALTKKKTYTYDLRTLSLKDQDQ